MGSREDYPQSALLLPALAHLGWARPRSASESGLGAHQHQDAWEVCWLRRGRVEWWVGDEAFIVPTGSCYLTRPNEWHGAVHSVLEPCELYWLGLRSGAMPEIDTALLAAPRVFPGTAAVGEWWEDLLQQHRQPHAAHAALAAQASLTRLMVDIVRCAQSAPTLVVPSPAIVRAQTFAHEHLAEEPSVAALARAAGLSPSQFHARFAAEVGEAPAEWMRRMRLDRARRALAASDAPITSIGLDLGFPSSQYFATVFRRYTGMTPRAYREHARGSPT